MNDTRQGQDRQDRSPILQDRSKKAERESINLWCMDLGAIKTARQQKRCGYCGEQKKIGVSVLYRILVMDTTYPRIWQGGESELRIMGL